ncbi:hypothetical protein DFH09DRAFT_479143 [Mycena vulgaris]|nr:hypothetical protein DFH09DRAFT_215680 [Mycena vulgaris]KAJ6563737.1 hypothetical protein DFH09DRAFT_479143 [Mycena vulgaris]
MDIIGVVASALQLVDALVKARDYIHGFRDAPEDQQAILRELISIKPLLQQLDKRIKNSGATSIGAKQLEQRMLDLNGLVKQLTTILKPVLSPGRKTLKRIEWTLWGKNDAKEALTTIERFKTMCIWESVSDLAEEQRTDNQSMINSVQHGFKNLEDAREGERLEHQDISKSVRDVARNQKRYQDYQNSAERDKIIEWFSPLNLFLRQADIFSTRQPGTGEWFLQHELFKRWRSGEEQTIWCCGMPGAGKTVLASIVVDDLRVRANLESQSTGVAALYLNHQETGSQSPSNLLAGLWRQLVFEKKISPSVHRLHEKHREPRTRPSLEDIHDVICSAVADYSKVFIIVDALDEYPERQRDILLYRLSSLGSTVNLMLTSRPHITLNRSFRILETLEIRATEDDIRKHLDAEISRSSRLSKHIENRPNLREEIVSTIVRRSDGMFLLAKLHIDSLTTKHTVKAVRGALAHMPTDLNSTYDEVVERINRQTEDDKMLAWRTLSWVTNAKRPLRPSELQEALAVEPGTKELDPDNRLDMNTILSVCAGLVVINEADKRVRLIHYTMQTYFDGVQARDFPRGQTDITMSCITYLSFDIFSQALDDALTLNLFRRNSLLDYAVEHCLVHARGRPEWDIRDSILSFLLNSYGWWKLWNWKHSYDNRRKSAAPLWIAAAFQLDNICRHLLQGGFDGGAALHEAALAGLSDIVQILIDTGVHPDAVRMDNKRRASALQAASTRGHTDTIRLLLDHGASTEFRGFGRLDTPLQIAARFGHKLAVCLLVLRGAHVNARPGPHGSALYAASTKNHYDIVRILLAHGADVQTRNEGLGTALSAASRKTHKAIYDLLIKHGAPHVEEDSDFTDETGSVTGLVLNVVPKHRYPSSDSPVSNARRRREDFTGNQSAL